MNNYFIKKIGFTKDFRTFKNKDLLELNPGINIMVGDQGCGKSSLFYALANFNESGVACDYVACNFIHFDTEKMNPRFQETFKNKYSKNELASITKYDKAEFNHALNRLLNDTDEKSHGTVMLETLLDMDVENNFIQIDEPESGLSIRSQYKLLKYYKKLAEKNQLLIATHSLILMNGVDNVLSLEHKKWMTSDEFINTQK